MISSRLSFANTSGDPELPTYLGVKLLRKSTIGLTIGITGSFIVRGAVFARLVLSSGDELCR